MTRRLVLVHGFLGSAANWGPILHRLKSEPELANWSFEAPDLLGHGRRRMNSEGPLSLDAIAKDLLEQLGEASPFVAVGHSFGVRPLLRISSLKPGVIEHLIVEDSSPVLSEEGFRELGQIFAVPVPFETRDLAKASLEKAFGEDSRMARFLLANIRESSEGHTWRFDRRLEGLLEASVQEALWTEWENFPGSLHMIVGGRSRYIPRARLEECVRRRAPGQTSVQSLDQAGHWVHADDPEGFVRLLSQTLASL